MRNKELVNYTREEAMKYNLTIDDYIIFYDEQNEKDCLGALKYIFKFSNLEIQKTIGLIKNPTFEICKLIIDENVHYVRYINNLDKNNELCIKLLSKYVEDECGSVLAEINVFHEILRKNHSEEVALFAINLKSLYIGNVQCEQTEEMCFIALKYSGLNLTHIKNPTEEMCIMAIKECPTAVLCIKNFTENICIEILKLQNFDYLDKIKNLITIDMVKEALSSGEITDKRYAKELFDEFIFEKE